MITEVTTQEVWDEFVLPCAPNTFLHSWEWGQSQKADGESVKYLGIFDEDAKQIGAALVLTIFAKRGTHYLIPHGPILKDEADAAAVLRELRDYLQAQAAHEKVVALRVAPLLLNSPETLAMFKGLGFHPAPLHVHAELTWVRDLPDSDDALLADMRKTTRHAITKAHNQGVQTSILPASEILDRFWPLYKRTSERHSFVLYPRQLIKEQLHTFGAHDRVYGVLAQYQNADVAAAIVFQYGETCFYYHGASEVVPKVSPAQALQFAAMREARRRGATRYNFWGIAPPGQPKHPFTGITTFKQGFGGYAIDYTHAQDYPLHTVGYTKLWLIESFRRWRRGF